MADLISVAQPLVTALNARDQDALRRLVPESAWVMEPGSLRILLEAPSPPPPLSILGSMVKGARGVVGLHMQSEGAAPQKAWLLLSLGPAGRWEPSGLVGVAAHAGRFLDGVLPAVWKWNAKPPHVVAEEWAELFIQDLMAGEAPSDPHSAFAARLIDGIVRQGIIGGEVKRSLHLDEFARAVVGFTLSTTEKVYQQVAVLDIEGDSVRPRTITPGLRPAAFFIGLTWEDEPTFER